jgi:hypothetical protein
MLSEHLTDSDGMFTDSFGTRLNPLERSLHYADGLSLEFQYPILSSKALIELLQVDISPVSDTSAALNLLRTAGVTGGPPSHPLREIETSTCTPGYAQDRAWPQPASAVRRLIPPHRSRRFPLPCSIPPAACRFIPGGKRPRARAVRTVVSPGP